MSSKKLEEDVPILYFNTEPEDREAYHAMDDSGIPHEKRVNNEDTPLLVVGYTRYKGIDEIKEFIEEHCQKHL